MPDAKEQLGTAGAGGTPVASPARGALIWCAVAVLLIPAVLGSSQTIFNDGDVSWHIATGQWILGHRAIPQTDPFSFTWLGKPWVPIEWLSEVLYAAAYRLADYSGVAALVTAALIALHFIVVVSAMRTVRPASALAIVILMDAVLIPMMLARPHLLTWPLLAFWTYLMVEARERDGAPPLIASLLMAVWANLHGGFVFALAIAAAFGLEALVQSTDKARALRFWLIFGLASLAACLLNGNGLEGVFHPLRFTQLHMLPLIDEWKPSSLSRTPLFFAVLVLVAVIVVWRRPRMHWVRWLLLVVLLGLALMQARHQSLLAIVAAIILPRGFARDAEAPAFSDWRVAWLGAAGGALLVAARLAMPMIPPENEANPWKLIALVPPELRQQRVLNGYSMGGPLILKGIRPYVDGRGDMYGDELILPYARLIRGDWREFTATVQRWNIRWVILPNRNKLIPMLSGSPEWRLVARDQVGAIYARR